MALVQHQECVTCGKDTLHVNGECTPCRSLEIQREVRLEKARWRALTPEERIDELLLRIESLERANRPICY